jgi:hypothetical protein
VTYTDLTFEDLFRLFHVSLDNAPLFRDVQPLAPSPWLVESLQRGQGMALLSEKARGETIVAPILLECQGRFGANYSIYSGVSLEVNGDMNLKGECDFIVARAPKAPFLRAPLLVIVEAKRAYLEGGIAQCASQMLAARRFNDERNCSIPLIYGCVTSGEDWQFLRLDGTCFMQDVDRYYIRDLDKILGILVSILKG